MTQWLVGFRDGDTIDDVLLDADTAADAAGQVREARPAAIIIAVMRFPKVTAAHKPNEYSDLPAKYEEVRRFVGPTDGPHGYVVVAIDCDGTRRFVPDRPMALDQAIRKRDWLLPSYFSSRHAHLRFPHVFGNPVRPVIAEIRTVDRNDTRHTDVHLT
ncbi:hypothetical protein [Curtobacterium poinsettiae]|uniref:hypothetical protein n=1 Tax=Curtobacterium poinsettiae TaxID=159612 RepID=UPI001BDF2F96|nr:hypothetical protein [Curtobacterium flaccumfaciens]MBT1611869.1 hypothetical protein [Curtobacterium flaccumfaciens pv. poinsettiae]